MMEQNTSFTSQQQSTLVSILGPSAEPKSSDDIKCRHCSYPYAKKMTVEGRYKVYCVRCTAEYYIKEQTLCKLNSVQSMFEGN